MSFSLKNVGFTYPAKLSTPSHSTVPVETPWVLKDVNLEFPAGSRVALLGPSGVGKSTLICILGLLTGTKQFEGTIQYVDSFGETHQYQGMPVAKAESLRRTEFGFALQSSYLLPHLTVAENLGIPLGLNGFSEQDRRARALELLATADQKLAGLADALPSELSGGQRQRVAVLRAVIHNPTVVFADEPFSALDETNKHLILQMLVQWQEGGLIKASPVDSRTASSFQTPSRLQDSASSQADDGMKSQCLKTSHPGRTLFLVCHDPEVPRRYEARVLQMKNHFEIEFAGAK